MKRLREVPPMRRRQIDHQIACIEALCLYVASAALTLTLIFMAAILVARAIGLHV